MHKVRVIPVLLLKHWGLEKSVAFRDPVYIGSPINAVRVFNQRNVDELILLDIVAGAEGRGPHPEVVAQIAEEAHMPLTAGGGIRDIETMRQLLDAGVDRLAINSAAQENPRLITEGAERFGSQCMVVSIDAKRERDGSWQVYTHGGTCATGKTPLAVAQAMAAAGAGEILLTSIDRDGSLSGYDIELIRQVSDGVDIPVIACGGAGSVADLAEAVDEGHASAVAAGAFFLFFGPRRTVLITYPEDEALIGALGAGRVRKKDAVLLPPCRI